jgi:homoserine kinase
VGVTVRVPATVANLGPGFDSFGLALGLADELSAEDAAAWSVTVEGAASRLVPEDETNVVVRTMRAVFESAGEPERRAALRYTSRIPVGGGLGSSAAATIAGILAADTLLDARRPAADVVDLAARAEGHADNVAAAVMGGFTVALQHDDAWVTRRIEPTCGLAAVVVTSEHAVSTGDARTRLPDAVPFGDAAFNSSRAGALVAGILLCDRELAALGFEERLHEASRAGAVPDLELVRDALLEAGADGAVLSGAGPTVAGILLDEDDASAFERARIVAGRAEGLLAGAQGRGAPTALPVDRTGAMVS